MNDNNGHDEVCEVCGYEGHTAHDITWDEVIIGWVCDVCHEPPEDVRWFS